MKTIYLKHNSLSELITDLSFIFSGYNGELEYSNEDIHLHIIGQIPKSFDSVTGEVIDWIDGVHANVLAPENFDESIFSSLVISPPNNPIHKFA